MHIVLLFEFFFFIANLNLQSWFDSWKQFFFPFFVFLFVLILFYLWATIFSPSEINKRLESWNLLETIIITYILKPIDDLHELPADKTRFSSTFFANIKFTFWIIQICLFQHNKFALLELKIE